MSDESGAFSFRELPLGRYGVVALTESVGHVMDVRLDGENPVQDVVLRLLPVGAITGTVRDASGNVVPDALIRPILRGQPAVSYHDFEAAPVHALSDATGRFTLVPLARDSWRLEASARGFAPVRTDWLTPGEDVEITLVRGAHISGRVLDEDSGEPVPGLTVLRSRRLALASADDWVATRTDEKGQFLFVDLADGSYKVIVEDVRLTLVHPAPMATVADGASPAPLELVAAPGGIVSGRVFDPERSEGLSAVTIFVDSMERPQLPGRETLTAADGRFRIEGLAHGTYSLRRGPHPGYPGTFEYFVNFASGPGELLTDVNLPVKRGLAVSGVVYGPQGEGEVGVRVVVSGSSSRFHSSQHQRAESDATGAFTVYGFSPEHRLEIEATRAGLVARPQKLPGFEDGQDLTGVVVHMMPAASISGTVRDPEGHPVVGLRVTASAESTLRQSATTDTVGDFRIDSLAAGTYTLGIRDSRTRQREREPGARSPVDLARGEQRTGVELTFEAREGHTIEGIVVSTDGLPVPDAMVLAASPGYAGANTDAEGRFTLFGLKNTEYEIDVTHWRYGRSQDLKIHAGSVGVEVVLQPTSTVAGTVIDARTGEPVREFELSTLPGEMDWERWRRPGLRVQHAHGHFRHTGVLAGDLSIHVRASGFVPWTRHLSGIEAGEHVDGIVVELEFGLRAVVQVVTQSGAPIQDAQVFIGEAPDFWERRMASVADTDSEGRCELDGLEPKPQQISASHPGYMVGSAFLSGTREVEELRIERVPASTISVRASFPKGVKARRARISARSASGLYELSDTLSRKGGFALREVPEGTLTVTVGYRKRGVRRSRSRVLEVASGEKLDLVFDFAPTDSVLWGTVHAPGEGSVEGWVTLTFPGSGDENETYTRKIGRDGDYRFESVPAGDAHLQVEVRGTFRHQAVQVRTLPGQEVRSDIHLSGGCRVVGRFHDSGGSPWRFAAALRGEHEFDRMTLPLIMKLQTRLAATIEIDAEGRFVLEGLQPDTYTLVVMTLDEAPGNTLDLLDGRVVTQVVQLERDQEIEVDLRLPPAPD